MKEKQKLELIDRYLPKLHELGFTGLSVNNSVAEAYEMVNFEISNIYGDDIIDSADTLRELLDYLPELRNKDLPEPVFDTKKEPNVYPHEHIIKEYLPQFSEFVFSILSPLEYEIKFLVDGYAVKSKAKVNKNSVFTYYYSTLINGEFVGFVVFNPLFSKPDKDKILEWLKSELPDEYKNTTDNKSAKGWFKTKKVKLSNLKDIFSPTILAECINLENKLQKKLKQRAKEIDLNNNLTQSSIDMATTTTELGTLDKIPTIEALPTIEIKKEELQKTFEVPLTIPYLDENVMFKTGKSEEELPKEMETSDITLVEDIIPSVQRKELEWEHIFNFKSDMWVWIYTGKDEKRRDKNIKSKHKEDFGNGLGDCLGMEFDLGNGVMGTVIRNPFPKMGWKGEENWVMLLHLKGSDGKKYYRGTNTLFLDTLFDKPKKRSKKVEVLGHQGIGETKLFKLSKSSIVIDDISKLDIIDEPKQSGLDTQTSIEVIKDVIVPITQENPLLNLPIYPNLIGFPPQPIEKLKQWEFDTEAFEEISSTVKELFMTEDLEKNHIGIEFERDIKPISEEPIKVEETPKEEVKSFRQWSKSENFFNEPKKDNTLKAVKVVVSEHIDLLCGIFEIPVESEGEAKLRQKYIEKTKESLDRILEKLLNE